MRWPGRGASRSCPRSSTPRCIAQSRDGRGPMTAVVIGWIGTAANLRYLDSASRDDPGDPEGRPGADRIPSHQLSAPGLAGRRRVVQAMDPRKCDRRHRGPRHRSDAPSRHAVDTREVRSQGAGVHGARRAVDRITRGRDGADRGTWAIRIARRRSSAMASAPRSAGGRFGPAAAARRRGPQTGGSTGTRSVRRHPDSQRFSSRSPLQTRRGDGRSVDRMAAENAAGDGALEAMAPRRGSARPSALLAARPQHRRERGPGPRRGDGWA